MGSAYIPNTPLASSARYVEQTLQKRRGFLLFGGMKSRMLASPWKVVFSGLKPAAPTNGAPPLLRHNEQWQ